MTSCTDPLGFNDQAFFKELKKSFDKDNKDTRNIIGIRDDILFAWHDQKSCILTFNVNTVRIPNKNLSYQSLLPTDPPIFDVKYLVINETLTQVALWGNLGVVVVELPKRWGKEANFQGGKDVISCLSHNLDISEVRQVRWHPGSTTDSHLLVLASENVFHLYECELGVGPNIVKTWKVGPASHSPSKSIPNFVSLGESAIDFDFASPTVKDVDPDKVTWDHLDWPILVLRGNGDVLIVRGNFLCGNATKPVVLGTLSMYPQTMDNYGTDSCAIMCLQTTPPIVAIAECSGKIYHSVLLPGDVEDKDEAKSWSQYGSTFSLHTPDEALYVYECVEMELGLFYTDLDSKYNCPIQLHRDRENRSRYFCSSNAGIHVINVPMVQQLDESEPQVLKQSNAHYLVSTRTKYTDRDEATPVLGFGLLREPCVLIAILYTGVVVDLSIADFYYVPKAEQGERTPQWNKKAIREDFATHVKKILTRDTSRPVTKLGLSKNLAAKDYLELLIHATSTFRKQYFAHHDRVREEFGKKVKTLKALKNHQSIEVEALTEMKGELQERAENLAERYEDIKDKQEELVKRSEEVLRLVNLKEPYMNSTERAEAEEIKKMSDKVKELGVRIEQLKKKKATNEKVAGPQVNGRVEKSEVVFKESQIETIKKHLGQMGKDVATLIARVKTIQDQVDV